MISETMWEMAIKLRNGILTELEVFFLLQENMLNIEKVAIFFCQRKRSLRTDFQKKKVPVKLTNLLHNWRWQLISFFEGNISLKLLFSPVWQWRTGILHRWKYLLPISDSGELSPCPIVNQQYVADFSQGSVVLNMF